MATSTTDIEPSPKKLKLDSENTENGSFETLEDFIPEKILSNNSNRKTICVLGKFKNKSDNAIVLLEKKAFADNELLNSNSGFLTDASVLKLVFQNDVYLSYECFPNIEINGLKTTIIYPASEKHVQKFQSQEVHIVEETYEKYLNITLPHIENEKFSLQWVYNILEHKTEVDRIVFEDSDPEIGFILLPDLKWDGKTLETLYLVAITHRRDIKSLRDLTKSELPLLKNILEKGVKAIEEKYKLPKSQLRIYLHYQPSFYHLHIHFTYLKYEAPGIHTEKSHLLSQVISNIELLPDYYQKVTLPFVLRENDNLYAKFN